jgi:PIN domain nuclease of toxin-antitoxin system
MRLLLDTLTLLWLLEDNPRLSPSARSLIVSASEVYVSSATIWEISIKARLGKIRTDPEEVLVLMERAGLRELPVNGRHAVAIRSLPLVHRDPFDRMLVAQAMCESMRLLTADPQLAAYSKLVVTI